jgi:hypothetical protein
VLAHICRSVGTISIRLDEASGAISVKLGAFSYLTAWRMRVAAVARWNQRHLDRGQPGGLPIRSVGCFVLRRDNLHLAQQFDPIQFVFAHPAPTHTPNLTVLMCGNMTFLQTAHKINTNKPASRHEIKH